MRRSLLSYLFSFEGRITRTQYLLTGAILLALKFLIDHTVAAHFGEPWKIWTYFVPPTDFTIFGLGARHPNLYLILWAIAIPFFWIGIALTLRRLRDAGLRLGWVLLFFVPVANLFFFLYLSLVPSAETIESVPSTSSGQPRLGFALAGLLFAAALGLALVFFGADILARYAWGLFLGVPFVTGFLASWIMNTASLRSRAQTIAVSALVPIFIGFALIGFRMEGLVCLLMAVPLALPFSIAGGLTAYYCLRTRRQPFTSSGLTACVAILPLLMLVEQHADVQPPVRPVTTSITVNAPVDVVWKNVIAFSPLPPPKELLFRAGIAFPIGAAITGSGPGAIRRCRFSTGDFVEPITVWDRDHLLAFNVASEPPSLHELGLGPIHTPHIERNYMRSRHGQFHLVALDANHTLLEGTTWYQDYFWPQIYWRAWSDFIVHRIHMRVLEQVKVQAESQSRLPALARISMRPAPPHPWATP
jgi:uncharacterized membrane protein YhaH (DUF805 family)